MPKRPLPPPPTTETVVGYQIGQQGANHRDWLKIVRTTDAQGNTALTTNLAYVELATGLNYEDPTTGKWLPSREEIDAYPGGAIAQYGQHKVIFANNLNTAGAIDLQMPGGQEMKSDVLGLSYYDTASGKSVLIAEVQNSQGQIVSSNEVLYPNAFNGVKASVLYKYTLAGLEQDVVLQEQPPSPQSFGLSSTSCVLQVLTEFTTAPTPTIHCLAAGTTTNGPLTDEWLDFGTMNMVPGKAFLLGTNSPSARVYKQWLNVNGRTVLVESVPLPAISASLSQLPAVAQASLKPAAGSGQYVVSSQRRLPPPRIRKGTKTQMELAKTSGPAHGLALDYLITISGDPANYTFHGDDTYYISAPLYLSGTTTFEGGAVLKYANNAFVDLSASTQINCLTAPYRPVVFTAATDNSVGNPVTPVSPSPSGYYANPAIKYVPYGYGSLTLSHFRIEHAYQAVYASASNMTVSLSDGQIVNCGSGFYTPGETTAYLENMLFANVQPLDLYLANVQAQNVTFDGQYSALVAPAGSGPNYNVTLNLVNCILANFTVFSTVGTAITITGDHNGFYNNYNYPPTFGNPSFPCNNNPFQTAAGGNYYLATNPDGTDASGLRGKGTTSGIDSALQTDLKTKTTWPPNTDYVGKTISSPTTLQPRGLANTGTPDLGYHYPILDYILSNTVVDADFTNAPGTAVGWQGQGLTLAGDYTINFNGTVVSNCYFVRCNTVQESDQSGDGTGIAGNYYSPTVNATFTRFSALNDLATFLDANFYDSLISIYNCEFRDGQIGGNAVGYLYLTCCNCLFDRSFINFSVAAGSLPNTFDLQNCTLHSGKLSLTDPFNAGSDFKIHDTAIDGTTLSYIFPSGDYVSFSYNAYLNGASPLPNDTNDKTVSSFTWQSGPLGNFYLPPGCALIDAGDQPASDVDVVVNYALEPPSYEPLSDFTTQTNQDSDSGTVDIGYHYPFVLLKGDVLVSGNNSGFCNASPNIDTFRFGDSSFFRSFGAATAGNGRGLAIYNGDFYYTGISCQPYGSYSINVCPYGTDPGSGGPDDTSKTITNPDTRVDASGNTAGIAALSFHYDPNQTPPKTELYALTGYDLITNKDGTVNLPEVWEIDPETKQAVHVNGTDFNYITIPTPVDPAESSYSAHNSDGFTVLLNGDFLINDYDGADGATTYREYSGTTGQLVTGGLVIDVSSFSSDVGFTVDGGAGVACAPNGELYFVVAHFYVLNNETHCDDMAIVHTNPDGEYLSSQVITSETTGIEDIDVLVGQ